MKYMFRAIAVLALILFTSPYVMAGQVGATNTFTANTPARADEVNANFNVLKTEVNDNDTRITINATKSLENMAEISLNGREITANGFVITGNTAGISRNNVVIGNNSTAIGSNSIAIGSKLPSTVNTCFTTGESIQQINPNGTVICGASSTLTNSVGQLQLIEGIPGVAWSEQSNPVILDRDEITTTVTSVNITPPSSKPGFFVVSASAQMHKEIKSIAKDVRCGLSRGIPNISDKNEPWMRFTTNNDDQTISLDSVFTSDGRQKLIYLLCRRVNKNEAFPLSPAKEAVEVVNANLNVIFVPMEYNTFR